MTITFIYCLFAVLGAVGFALKMPALALLFIILCIIVFMYAEYTETSMPPVIDKKDLAPQPPKENP